MVFSNLVTFVWLLLVFIVYLSLYLFCNYGRWRWGRKENAATLSSSTATLLNAAETTISISIDESSGSSNDEAGSNPPIEGDFV